jgi:hypothetical protein
MIRNSNIPIGTVLKSILISTVFSVMVISGYAQSIPKDSLFLGQIPPGNKPEKFPLSVNKEFFAAERIAISNDGREIYYSEIKGYYPIRGENIKKYTYSDSKWTGPFKLFDGYGPALSVTGDTMYFERKDLEKNSETYISVRNGKAWGDPKRILNRLDKAHYCQLAGNGNYYISTKSGEGQGLNDWCRVIINGADTTVLNLGTPLNTAGENLDFFVARDESFMIITRPVGLAISFNKNYGTWTDPVNLGKKINFGLGMWGPWVTRDNRFLFYSTGTKPDYSDVSVKWVRIDGIIDSLRQSCSIQFYGK